MSEVKPTVFVVDDEPEILELLEILFNSNRYSVQTFHNGQELIAQLRVTKPDVILLDIIMPGMDGYALCKMIKGNPKLQDVKIIFVSARTSDADIKKGMECGADSYIKKPFENRKLVAEVKRLINPASHSERHDETVNLLKSIAS